MTPPDLQPNYREARSCKNCNHSCGYEPELLCFSMHGGSSGYTGFKVSPDHVCDKWEDEYVHL